MALALFLDTHDVVRIGFCWTLARAVVSKMDIKGFFLPVCGASTHLTIEIFRWGGMCPLEHEIN